MVIKGSHFQRMHEKFSEFKGKLLSVEDVEYLKQFAKDSRADAGSIKSKNHPSWLWFAGYLDGDGSFGIRQRSDRPSPEIWVSISCHINDRVGIDLISKAFGGGIYTHAKNTPHILDWKRNLAVSQKSFAVPFLKRLANLCVIKRHKIEQILNFYSQRLTEENPTG